MSDEERWIVVPNWDKFQHYKDRSPVWIKVYPRLLDNPRFLGLTDKQRGLLFSIWLLYAASGGEIPASAAYLAQKTGGITEWEYRQKREAGESDVRALREAREFVVRGTDLKALEQAEFIRIVASKPLAQRREEKKETRARAREEQKPKARQPAETRTNAAAYQPFDSAPPEVIEVDQATLELARKWLRPQ